MIRCGPVAPKFACCGRLRLLTAPQGGAFGLPSASILGQYTWEHGGYDCDGCDAPVSLEPVAEEFMGGTAWTFITRRNQYPVFAHQPKEASCPENVTRWKYWSAKEVRERMRPARPARRAPPTAAEPTGRRLPSRRRRTLAATLRSSASASRWS